MGVKAASSEAGSTHALRDGVEVLIRELCESDDPALHGFVAELSEEAIYFRFLTGGIDAGLLFRELSPKSDRFTLVAVLRDRIVAHAVFYRATHGPAEIGLLVLDECQGRGLGTRLIEMLAREANDEGITAFEAVIGWNNTRMIRMVRHMGFPTSEKVEPDLIRIRFPTSIDPVSISEFQEQWRFRPS